MSLTVPTTQQISDNIITQLEASLSQTIPLLPKAFSRVLAKVLAGVFVILYRYAGFIFLQMFVAHASFRTTTILGKQVIPLVEWGRLFGVGDPTAATRAQHTISITVLDQTGSLPGGTQLVRTETGVIYQTVAVRPLDAATVTVDMVAISDPNGGGGAGTLGNLQVGDKVSFINPLAKVAQEASVTVQTVTGADAETETQYRQRVIDRVKRPPQGGAYSDYHLWATTVAGIVNVYPYTGNPGEVDVYCEATEASSGDPDGVPTAPQLTAVAAAIQYDVSGLPSRRPAGAAVNVLGITRTAVDMTVFGLTPDTAELRTAIEEAVEEYLRDREPYIEGLTVLPKKNKITTGEVVGIAHQVANANAASLDTVTLEISAIPIVNYDLSNGEKTKLGTPTYS